MILRRSCALLGALFVFAPAAAQDVDPYPRQEIGRQEVTRWEFSSGASGWRAANHCTVQAKGGALVIVASGSDPYLHGPGLDVVGPIRVCLRLRGRAAGGGQIFWITRRSPRWDERKSAHFALVHDGTWRDVVVPLAEQGTITGIRLDPGAAPGTVEIESIALARVLLHPLQVESVEATGQALRLGVRNHASKPIEARVGAQRAVLAPGARGVLEVPADSRRPFEGLRAEVQAAGLPPLIRSVFVYRPVADTDWAVRALGETTLRVALDGSGARIEVAGRPLAVLAPIVHRDGVVPLLTLESRGPELRLRGEDLSVSLRLLPGGEVGVSIKSQTPCEGPVLRALGSLEQGLFAGLEYLGKGERSSSSLDLETPERIRFVPDRLKLTLPLMACRTDEGTVALTWSDMSLQPVFASPNAFDGAPDHRMTLRGREIEATVRAGSSSLEDSILWAVRRRGLPPLPVAPREPAAQAALCLRAIEGPLKSDQGWGHCAESRWPRRFHADIASTIWHLTGEVPRIPRVVGGGAHLTNDAIYLVSGRAKELLVRLAARRRATLAEQKPDGSFRYQGEYRRGHFEDTSSGHCASRAAVLLEDAWLTGDRQALEGGLRALEFTERFRTPRGAQTWELSLHTPDILAAAHLVRAHVRGFQLTGRPEHLARARQWALSGVPFVYLWSRHPTMAYATVPVYGATHWRAPCWIGLPVQWCGIVYARALALLAPLDDSLDWSHLAWGILLAGERMQYEQGPRVGCLPDIFELTTQRGSGPSINPCALVALRRALEGKIDSLAVATGSGRRVVSPFPVRVEDGVARVAGRAGVRYQLVVDGERVVDVTSSGEDVVPLD